MTENLIYVVMTMEPRFEQLEARQLLASDWQNATNPYDVDNSGTVQAFDVL